MPSLDLFEEWKGDEAVIYTEIGFTKVKTELVDK